MICGFFGSYLEFLFGSEVLAADEGCEERYSGWTARWPAAGCEEGILRWYDEPDE